MNRKQTIYFILLSIICSSFSFSIEKYVDYGLIKKAEAPRFVREGILITLPQDIGYSYFLRTNFDNWQKDHLFTESNYGIHYLIIPYNPAKEKLLYKLNVNGFWITDPHNPNYMEDKYGTPISYITQPDKSEYLLSNPIIPETEEKVKKVLFRYFNPGARDVNLVNSAYNMSYYSNPMYKVDDEYWEIELYLTDGDYYYFLFVDGEKISDPRNENKQWHAAFGQISVFQVE